MEENRKNQKKTKFTFSSLLRGQIVKDVLGRDIWFVLYIFLIIILYISVNLGVEKTQITIRKNQLELKNLKAEYTGKTARLQSLSKRGEVKERLEKQNSSLINPVSPPIVLER